MSEFAIREAAAEDVPTILCFVRQMVEEMAALGGHPASQQEDVWKHLGRVTRAEVGRKEHLYLLAELRVADIAAIGLAEARVLRPDPVFDTEPVLHIHALYVLQAYRRIGVGRALLATLLDWGRCQGCGAAELNVLQGSPARALYEDLGFRPFQLEMRWEL